MRYNKWKCRPLCKVMYVWIGDIRCIKSILHSLRDDMIDRHPSKSIFHYGPPRSTMFPRADSLPCHPVKKCNIYIMYVHLTHVLRTSSNIHKIVKHIFTRMYDMHFENKSDIFRGMHVSPAKHSYAWLQRKCEYWTDRRMGRRQSTVENWPHWRMTSPVIFQRSKVTPFDCKYLTGVVFQQLWVTVQRWKVTFFAGVIT